MNCHACGREASLDTGGRVGFRDECGGCGADLHVCRNCARYDPDAYSECGETGAARVSDKDRANRCDDFAPGAGQGGTGDAAGREKTLSQLHRLFEEQPA